MFVRTRRLIKFLILLIMIGSFAFALFQSPPVQRLLYPILYPEHIFRYADLYKVDPYLVAAVIKGESRFSHTAESVSGARGLMQIMPDTAKWAAEKLDIEFHPELLYEPGYNIRMGCWYLRELIDNFSGNLVLVLAAYNAGQGNVKKWLETGVWDGSYEKLEQIPFPETRFYVGKVLRYYEQYQKIYKIQEMP